jgi:hypothetical protein
MPPAPIVRPNTMRAPTSHILRWDLPKRAGLVSRSCVSSRVCSRVEASIARDQVLSMGSLTATMSLKTPKGSLGSHQRFMHVAPAPVLSRFKRLDDRVATGMEVFSCVPIWRGVATADMPACQAQAQVDPSISRPQAILTPVCMRRNGPDRAQMRVSPGALRHVSSANQQFLCIV